MTQTLKIIFYNPSVSTLLSPVAAINTSHLEK